MFCENFEQVDCLLNMPPNSGEGYRDCRVSEKSSFIDINSTHKFLHSLRIN